MADLEDLNRRLDRLAAQLPQLIADYPDEGDFWMAFAGLAEAIEYKADEHTYPHVMQRINRMLAENGRYVDGVEVT
jgi:hypothetical protein